MASATPNLSLDTAVTAGDRDPARQADDDRRFFRFLLLAVLLHALLLVRVNTGEPRRLGAPGGADDAISVSIITEQDLKGRATVEDQAPGLPVPSAPPQPKPPPPEAQPTPDTPTPAQAAPAPPPPPPAVNPTPADTSPAPPAALRPTLPDEAIEPAPKQSDSKPAPEKQEKQEPADQPAKKVELTDDASKLLDLTKPVEKAKPVEKPAEATTKPPDQPKPPAKKTETAKLDLSPPAIFQAPVGGGGAGVQRPAGITRSGENDDFARGVIRALQATMPQLRNTFGRVTVRIELNMNGNLARTTVIKPSNVAGLDQNVVFATKQSSFPFPPRNAVPADLVFFVTYIYR